MQNINNNKKFYLCVLCLDWNKLKILLSYSLWALILFEFLITIWNIKKIKEVALCGGVNEKIQFINKRIKL